MEPLLVVLLLAVLLGRLVAVGVADAGIERVAYGVCTASLDEMKPLKGLSITLPGSRHTLTTEIFCVSFWSETRSQALLSFLRQGPKLSTRFSISTSFIGPRGQLEPNEGCNDAKTTRNCTISKMR